MQEHSMMGEHAWSTQRCRSTGEPGKLRHHLLEQIKATPGQAGAEEIDTINSIEVEPGNPGSHVRIRPGNVTLRRKKKKEGRNVMKHYSSCPVGPSTKSPEVASRCH